MKKTLVIALAAISLLGMSQAAHAGRYQKKVSCSHRACTEIGLSTTNAANHSCCQSVRVSSTGHADVCYARVNTAFCK